MAAATPKTRVQTTRLPHITLEQWRALISVVDEGGYAQAAEAMHMSYGTASEESHTFFVSQECFPQTIEVVRARAAAIGGVTVLVASIGRTERQAEAYGATRDLQEVVRRSAKSGLE